MQKILFIKGFATGCCECDPHDASYANIWTYFRGNPNYSIEKFDYSMEPNIDDLKLRLKQTIETSSPDIVMGHSMGGLLAFNHLRSMLMEMECNGTYVGPIPSRYIMLMPFLQATLFQELCAKLIPDSISTMSTIASCFISQPSGWCDSANILHTSFVPISYKQPLQAVGMLPKPFELVKVFNNSTSRIDIVYSTDETVTPIDESILSTLPNGTVHRTYGRHMAWMSHDTNFFDILDNVMASNV